MAADVTLIICLRSPVGRVGYQPTLQRHRCPCSSQCPPPVARYIGPNWSVALTEVGRLGWADMRAGAVTTSCARHQPPNRHHRSNQSQFGEHNLSPVSMCMHQHANCRPNWQRTEGCMPDRLGQCSNYFGESSFR